MYEKIGDSSLGSCIHLRVGLETPTAENWVVTKGFQMATQQKNGKVRKMRRYSHEHHLENVRQHMIAQTYHGTGGIGWKL